MRLSRDLDEIFLERTEPLLWSGCLIWKGARMTWGYGTMSIANRDVRMHRWSYERFVGPIPDGLMVDHICHERLCVEPTHLRLATPAQNARNRRGPTSAGSGLPRGVRRHGRDAFKAELKFEGKTIHLGVYEDVESASQAAAEGRARYFGEFAGAA